MKESLFYYQLDVNILKYSSLMDVLISPIAELTSTSVIICATVFLISLSLILKNTVKEQQQIMGAKISWSEIKGEWFAKGADKKYS